MPSLKRLFLLSVAAGLLMPMGYPPFHFYPGSLFAFLPLLLALEASRSARQAAFLSFLTGLIATAFLYSWILSFSQWAGWWAAVFYLLVMLGPSACFALFGIVFYGLKKKLSAVSALLAAPLVWSALEYLSTFGLFSQEVLGHSQLLNPLWSPGAPLFGVNYLSFLSVSFNAALALFFIKEREDLKAKILVALGIGSLILGNGLVKWLTPTLPPTTAAVAVALPQVPVEPRQINQPGQGSSIYQPYLATLKALTLTQAKLVVFPESSFPTAVNRMGRERYQLQNAMRGLNAELLLGGPEVESGQSFTTAFLFFEGEIEAKYQKERLFPYGEYFPKYSVFRWVRKYLPPKLRRDQFNPGVVTAPLPSHAGKLGVTICLESLYGDLVRKRVADGADFLVNLTNDSWFPGGYAAEKHFFLNRMRALENGRYFIQSALYGITGAIDPQGRVLAQTGPLENQSLVVTVHPLATKTLYTRLGPWRFLALGILTGCYFLLWSLGKRLFGGSRPVN